MNKLSRRATITGLLSLAGVLGWGGSLPQALGFGTASKFSMPTLVYDGPYQKRHGAQKTICWELMKRTSVECLLETPLVTLDDDRLFYHTFLYMSGNAAFPPFPDAQVQRLRRWLLFGGFLFVDGDPESGDGFDESVRALFRQVFPESRFEPLDKEHTLFRTFYLVDGRHGRIARSLDVEGLTKDDRTLVVYSKNDAGGAWMRDDFGNWMYPVYPGGEMQREMAIRFGINLAEYALCTNYKSDAVHVQEILKKRRR